MCTRLRVLSYLLFVMVSTASIRAADLPSTAFFEKKIRPVLVSVCGECHGANKQRGGLRLDSRAAMVKGGDRGAAVMPGQPGASLLLHALRYEDAELHMPPKGKLATDVVGAFTQWIRMGAPWPETAQPSPGTTDAKPNDASNHWAYQPIRKPSLPAVRNASWPQSPIDDFVLARLEAAEIAPAVPADKRTLIRRITFDLTGLPPTPAAIAAFLADPREDALARLVDDLLESPRYGERWGRHWLDVVRYADSNGLDENLAYVNAFRFRDYVIDSFNDDKPYDRFVQEQLAGDLLPPGPNETESQLYERLTGTGFLSLGTKMLACDDGRKMEMDIVDEQLDTTSRAIMGITMGCARCHDHKFDPFDSEDYYALAGIFKSTRTMENFKVVAEWHEHTLATEAEQAQAKEHDGRIQETDKAIKARERSARDAFLAAERGKAGAYLRAASAFVSSDGSDALVTEDNAAKVAETRGLDAEFLKQWIAHLEKAKDAGDSIWAVWALSDETTREALADTYAALFARADKAWKKLQSEGGDKKVAKLPDARLEAFRAVLYDQRGPFRLSGKSDRFYSTDQREAIKRLKTEKKTLEETRPQLARAMGVRDGKIENLRVHIRGNYLTLGDEVPRRFPRILSGPNAERIEDSTSGRLALARWLTSTDHPLTARVMANRIWQWHFGQGLVRTPDNFGRLGEAPSHPRLLDWLAVRFVEAGWSIKAMHRLILLSATYGMSTTYNAAAYAKDPENRLGWRFDRRRLAAEEIRDSILVLGGDLDLTMHGQLLPDRHRAYVTGTGSKESTYDFNRRTVYLPVLRSAVYPVLQAFDFADPSVMAGKRASTTVAPQALFMINGKIVLRESRRMAERLLADGSRDAARIERAYLDAFGRPALPAETERDLAFIKRYAAALPDDVKEEPERRIRAWQGLCRVLIASNEFIYIE